MPATCKRRPQKKHALTSPPSLPSGSVALHGAWPRSRVMRAGSSWLFGQFGSHRGRPGGSSTAHACPAMLCNLPVSLSGTRQPYNLSKKKASLLCALVISCCTLPQNASFVPGCLYRAQFGPVLNLSRCHFSTGSKFESPQSQFSTGLSHQLVLNVAS